MIAPQPESSTEINEATVVIARRISSGRQVLLADHRQAAADAAAKLLENAGFETTAMRADVSDRSSIQAVVRKAQELGAIKALAEGGAGVVISSQSGYRMPALTAAQDALLATAPAEELLALDFVKNVESTLHAYPMSKRCNSLRVRGEAIHWAKRDARINAISPGSDFLINGGAAANFYYGPDAEKS